MNILIIGSGAREHAIAKKLKQSQKNPQLFCCATSNNPGIAALTQDFLIVDICDAEEIANLAHKWKIDFAIIGPEAPLESGVADALWDWSIPVIGPKKNLAQIETSKAFARDLLRKYQINGLPQYEIFNNVFGTEEFLKKLGEGNYVIKADGLMGGKGVKVAGDHLHSLQEAYEFCQELMAQDKTFVIEEKLIGQEFSLLNFSDGTTLIPMPIVQDHKRAFVNDQGPNTGGMGSYSDANHSLPFLSKEDVQEAQAINQAVMQALQKECGEKYIGILYGSFIATKTGIKVIEFNARFGDPEVMNVLATLQTDLVEIFLAMTQERLAEMSVQFAPLATVCKYAVPEGYPTAPLKNIEINIAQVNNQEQLYLAAVDERDGKLFATGSRTAAVVGIAPTIIAAEKIAETEIKNIQGKLFHREDIGTEQLINRRIKHMQELRGCCI